jgi:ABC-type hemin transport system substrate-binding protein
MIAPALDDRIIGIDKMSFRTDAASELDLVEALFDLHVGGIAAPAPDALIGRESMFEPGA